MKIEIPEFSLVALVGASGSGKSSFSRKHFKPYETVSSDACRAMISDSDIDQTVTPEAFDLLYTIVGKRLARRKLTVIDATNVQRDSRKPIIEIAQRYHCHAVAIVFDLPADTCLARNSARPDRSFGKHVVINQTTQLRKSIRNLKNEGFRYIYVLKSEEEINQVEVTLTKLWTDKREETGPFDIIGDVHGCRDELASLLMKLGYQVDLSKSRSSEPAVVPPAGRKAVFVGDLVDRGPDSPGVLALVMNMVEHGAGLCVPGNHEAKLLKFLNGRDVQLKHGLERTVEQFEGELPEFKGRVRNFIDSLVSHYVLDQGKLVVAHAGMKAEYQGRASKVIREFALYGETTGEIDEYGFPVRHPWAENYRGEALVVYGHTPVVKSEWLNNTICLDTGCVFGGELTALRYPEKELVSVPANETHYEPIRPLSAPSNDLSAQQIADDALVIDDFLGKRIVNTRLKPNITIRTENSAAALETMSRFSVNPKWLVYLPPTMSPSETSDRPDWLERPEEVFKFFQKNGVEKVVCEEKHMGSRAVVVLCRNEQAAEKRFGITGEGIGVAYTRTGRPFFDEKALEQQVLERVRAALDKSSFWERLGTDWVVLDAEIMPWSLKATSLIKEQYAAVGAAAVRALSHSARLLKASAATGPEMEALTAKTDLRLESLREYREAYRRYCWPFRSLTDLKVAPFHVLATESGVHLDKDHLWHMQEAGRLAEVDPEFMVQTKHREVSLTDEASRAEAIAWWEDLTSRGGEGMVVKPFDFVATGRAGLVQPAVKCRGRSYLQLIYGPEYCLPDQLPRLKGRGLSAKRSLALREFALGIEALERFHRKEPLRKIHECVVGVLALESETTDPRL